MDKLRLENKITVPRETETETFITNHRLTFTELDFEKYKRDK